MKQAICSLITGPVILIGTTPLCHGSILSDDLTVPIVAFCSQFLVYIKHFHPFVYNSSSLCPKHMKVKTSFGDLYWKWFLCLVACHKSQNCGWIWIPLFLDVELSCLRLSLVNHQLCSIWLWSAVWQSWNCPNCSHKLNIGGVIWWLLNQLVPYNIYQCGFLW